MNLNAQEHKDVKALVFFVETVLHLNPTRMGWDTVQAYAQVTDRVKAALEGPGAADGGGVAHG